MAGQGLGRELGILNRSDTLPTSYNDQALEKEDVKKKKKEPPYSGRDLGEDPTKSPGEGFEWKGRGDPESGKGNWHNPKTQESLHPDLNHPSPKQPHWDYDGPDFPRGARLNLDGTWEPK